MNKIKVAIFGASGYMGEELVRILLRHPHAELVAITSRSNAGQRIGDVFPRYYEADLAFSLPDVDRIAATCDVAFLALPHGTAAEYAVPLVQKGVRVIDVSADFRLDDPVVYKQYYKDEHPAPELLAKAVYGLPERNREAIRQAPIIACPGCYPTSILVPTLPLLAAGLVETTGIAIASLSGVSGAGRKADISLLYAECNESLRPYAVTGHRHTSEIEQEMAKAARLPAGGMRINFVPHLVPVTRGIHTTIFFQATGSGVTADQVLELWLDAYADEPYVRVLPAGQVADTKHVTMTNYVEIGCAVDPRTGRIIVSSAIDNLTKGGSGQAVQCFNIIQGFDEHAGLV